MAWTTDWMTGWTVGSTMSSVALARYRPNGSLDPTFGVGGKVMGPAGIAINPTSLEVYAIDSVSNALSTFTLPELFVKPPSAVTR